MKTTLDQIAMQKAEAEKRLADLVLQERILTEKIAEAPAVLEKVKKVMKTMGWIFPENPDLVSIQLTGGWSSFNPEEFTPYSGVLAIRFGVKRLFLARSESAENAAVRAYRIGRDREGIHINVNEYSLKESTSRIGKPKDLATCGMMNVHF